jgi:hypothetical protein
MEEEEEEETQEEEFEQCVLRTCVGILQQQVPVLRHHEVVEEPEVCAVDVEGVARRTAAAAQGLTLIPISAQLEPLYPKYQINS